MTEAVCPNVFVADITVVPLPTAFILSLLLEYFSTVATAGLDDDTLPSCIPKTPLL